VQSNGNSKLMWGLLVGCLITGVLALCVAFAGIRDALRQPDLAMYYVAAALAFGLPAVAISRKRPPA